MHSEKLIFSLVLATALTVAYGQQTSGSAGSTTGGAGAGAGAAGATTGGGGGAGVGGPGSTTRTTTPFPTQTQPTFDQNQNRPIFLSGKVRMQDGAPPPESVTIERICAGRGTPIQEAYSDSKGNFSFQLGQRMGMMPDASMGNDSGGFGTGSSMPGLNNRNGGSGISERDLIGCEVRATLAGFRSTTVSLAGRRSLDNPDIGTIILRRLADVSGFTTSATSMMAPKDAKKALDKALNAMKKNKLPDAQKELETAVSIHPKYAEAWFELGRIQSLQKSSDQARESYGKAIEADDKFVKPYLGLALLEAQQNKWVEVKQLTDKIIKLNRYDFPTAFFYGAVANYNLRNVDEAEKLCRAGLEIDQFHGLPKMSHLLAMVLAEKQDFKGASEQLSAYLKFAPTAADADQVKKQLAEFEGKVAQAKP